VYVYGNIFGGLSSVGKITDCARFKQLNVTAEVGKEADFIVLNQNLFEIPQNQINQTKVIETYLKGELIYVK